jgi:hypothetical protein
MRAGVGRDGVGAATRSQEGLLLPNHAGWGSGATAGWRLLAALVVFNVANCVIDHISGRPADLHRRSGRAL